MKSLLLILILALSVLRPNAQNCTGINCEDGDACTFDFCYNGMCFISPKSCNDDNICTIDQCVSGTCLYSAAFCDDGLACTIDRCDSANGCYATPVVCDDGSICTTDICSTGNCIFTSVPGCSDPCIGVTCFDSDLCTNDGCHNGICRFLPIDCDDSYLCTTDSCAAGNCIYPPIDCDDGNACTNDECVQGSCDFIPVKCEDGNLCTTDKCINGNCFFLPVPGCSGSCAGVVCASSDLCVISACYNGICYDSYVNCNDGDPCTQDICVDGCIHAQLSCNDNNLCTVDQCSNGFCVYTATFCDDWNGACDFTLNCCTITADCNDNNACTLDACNNALCSHTFDCDDENLCTVDECAFGTCFNTLVNCDDGDICTSDSCLGGNCNFQHLPGCNDSCFGLICDDGDLCTFDGCLQGTCIYQPRDCDEGDPCTDDLCIEGTCINEPNNTCQYCWEGSDDCDDGDACTVDLCTNVGCINSLLNCNDNNACTIDQCEDSICIHSAAFCNDEDVCTNDDCDPALGCTASPLCDDGDACTTDICLNGNCTNTIVNCVTMSGVIISELGSPIPSATLNVAGQTNQTFSTGNNGLYEFNLPRGVNYTITPSKNNDNMTNNGISTLDIIFIQRHILAIQALNTPYKIIAADVNATSTVTTLDIVLIRSVILTNTPTFPNGKLWTFVPDDFQFANALNPFPYSKSRAYNNLNSNQTGADFIGIKLGDVNNSWDPNIHKTGTTGEVQFLMDEYHLMPGDVIIIPVKVKDFENIAGCQFSVSWNAEVVSLLEVSNGLINAHFGKNHISEGLLLASWDDENGRSITLGDDAVAFGLKFKVMGGTGSFSEIQVGSELIRGEAYNEQLNLLEVRSTNGMVQVGDAASAFNHQSSIVNLSVLPNPFNNATNIIFTLQKDATVSLIIYDVLGKVVKQLKADNKAGENKIEWKGDDEKGNELSKGLYYLQMRTEDNSKVVKVILAR